MRLLLVTFYASLTLAALGQLVAFGSGDQWLYGLPGVAVAILWGLALHRDWKRSYTLLFLSLLTCIIVGLWAGKSGLWLILSGTGGIVAWITGEFISRLRKFAEETIDPLLIRQFLLRLGLAALVGLLGGWLAIGIKIHLGFEIAIFLGLLCMIGLSRLVRYLIKLNNP